MRPHKPDYAIIICIGFLVVFGLVALASASSHLGQEKFGDSYYYLKHQLFYGLSLGVVGFLFGYSFYYRHYQKFALPALAISIVLLALVFTPFGFKAGGAERWVKLGPVTFQPSELLKITTILYLAAWLSGQKERAKNFLTGFVPFFLLIAVISILLFRQPATTTVVVILAAALVVYFVSGAKLFYILGTGAAAAAALVALVYLTPYRLERVTNFFKPADPLAGGYHLNQALIAIGSGGIEGVGYGDSTTKIRYLPEPIGDSIFAVVAEELGFIGSSVLIAVFGALVLKIFLLAKKTKEKFARLVLAGFGALIGIQTFINIGAISGLLPLTGVPLPFISYGGTALAVFMTMGGIVANISRHV